MRRIRYDGEVWDNDSESETELETKYQNLLSDYDELKIEYENLSIRTASEYPFRTSDLEQKNNKLRSKIVKLKSKNDKLESELSDAKERERSMSGQISGLTMNNRIRDLKKKEKDDKTQELQEENEREMDEKDKEIQELNRTLGVILETNKKLKTRADGLSSMLEDVTKESGLYKDRIEELSQIINDIRYKIVGSFGEIGVSYYILYYPKVDRYRADDGMTACADHAKTFSSEEEIRNMIKNKLETVPGVNWEEYLQGQCKIIVKLATLMQTSEFQQLRRKLDEIE